MADANFSRTLVLLRIAPKIKLSPFLNTTNRTVLQVPHTLEEEELLFNPLLDIKYKLTCMWRPHMTYLTHEPKCFTCSALS
jgi:hypothetical protein